MTGTTVFADGATMQQSAGLCTPDLGTTDALPIRGEDLVAQLSREEVCLGAKSWFDTHGGAGDADALRVYHCMCELGDQRLEDCVARLADSEETVTLERAEAAWRRLADHAEHLREGYL